MAAAEINTLEDAIAQLDALREECRRQSDTVEHYKRQAEQYFEELQHLKRQTPAAVGDEVGEDQAIRAERARLAELQSECEQQVRDLEIRSSLERAKLSRENSELRQHIEELQRQVKDLEKQVSIEGGGRRWMAKLGLNGEEPSE
jgi:chromosome segregation ATPase